MLEKIDSYDFSQPETKARLFWISDRDLVDLFKFIKSIPPNCESLSIEEKTLVDKIKGEIESACELSIDHDRIIAFFKSSQQ